MKTTKLEPDPALEQIIHSFTIAIVRPPAPMIKPFIIMRIAENKDIVHIDKAVLVFKAYSVSFLQRHFWFVFSEQRINLADMVGELHKPYIQKQVQRTQQGSRTMKALNHEELLEVSRNPTELKRYYQSSVMRWRKMAHENRKKSRQTALRHSVQDYKDASKKVEVMLMWARIEDKLADIVGQDVEARVRTTLEPAICTCYKIIINDTHS